MVCPTCEFCCWRVNDVSIHIYAGTIALNDASPYRAVRLSEQELFELVTVVAATALPGMILRLIEDVGLTVGGLVFTRQGVLGLIILFLVCVELVA